MLRSAPVTFDQVGDFFLLTYNWSEGKNKGQLVGVR